MADILARQRTIVGTTADWSAHNLTLGDGELALERRGDGTVRAKIGNGVQLFSEAPYLSGALDLAGADARFVRQAQTFTIGGAPAANQWPRLSANGRLDASLLSLPSTIRFKGTTDPAQPPPAGAIAGDAWATVPPGVVAASWGAPVAGLTANLNDYLIKTADGPWALLPGSMDIAGLVREIDLASVAGASMVGTQDAITVQQALDAHETDLANLHTELTALAIDTATDLRGRVAVAADRAALKALSPLDAVLCQLNEPGRQGLFAHSAGAPPTPDPQEGLYIVSPHGGFWARQWDRVEGRPEWFGAITGDSGQNCAVAIHACLALCRKTILSAADYWITETLVITENNRALIGVTGAVYLPGQGSRIILTGATCANRGTVLFVGKLAPVANVNDCCDWAHVEGMSLHRDYAAYPCAPHPSDKIINNDKAFIAGFCQNGRFSNIKTFGSRIGFQAFGCVSTDFTDCAYNGYNSIEGALVMDHRVGFLFGGPDVLLGMAGANASVRSSRCTAVVGSGWNPTGMLLWGRYVDTFVDDFETAQVKYGLVLDGTDLTGNNGDILNRGNVILDPNAHADTRLHRCTLDQCAGGGLFIVHSNENAMLEVVDCYATPNQADAFGIGLYDSRGAVTVTGGQILGNGTPYGVRASGSRSFTITGLKIRECYVPVQLITCELFRVEPHVQNYQSNAAGAAIAIESTSSRGQVGGSTAGGGGRFSMGVWVADTTSLVAIDTSAFSVSAIIGVTAAYKVRWNGVTDCRTEPQFAAQGNVLVGATG